MRYEIDDVCEWEYYNVHYNNGSYRVGSFQQKILHKNTISRMNGRYQNKYLTDSHRFYVALEFIRQ